MKCVLKFVQILLAVVFLFHFLTASVNMRAFVMIILPILISCSFVSGYVSFGHSGVGVNDIGEICNGVVVEVLMLSCFDAFIM